MPNDKNLKKVYKYLRTNVDGFTIDYPDFALDMANPENLNKVHTKLSEINPDFTLTFDAFQSDMGLAPKKKETPGPPMEEAPAYAQPISGQPVTQFAETSLPGGTARSERPQPPQMDTLADTGIVPEIGQPQTQEPPELEQAEQRVKEFKQRQIQERRAERDQKILQGREREAQKLRDIGFDEETIKRSQQIDINQLLENIPPPSKSKKAFVQSFMDSNRGIYITETMSKLTGDEQAQFLQALRDRGDLKQMIRVNVSIDGKKEYENIPLDEAEKIQQERGGVGVGIEPYEQDWKQWLGSLAGGQATAILVGVVSGPAAPFTTAATQAGQSRGQSVENYYNMAIDEGFSKEESINKAMKLSRISALNSTIEAAIGSLPLIKGGSTLMKAILSSSADIGLDATAAMTLQALENNMAKAEDLPVELADGILENGAGEAVFSIAMHLLRVPGGLRKMYTKSQLKTKIDNNPNLTENQRNDLNNAIDESYEGNKPEVTETEKESRAVLENQINEQANAREAEVLTANLERNQQLLQDNPDLAEHIQPLIDRDQQALNELNQQKNAEGITPEVSPTGPEEGVQRGEVPSLRVRDTEQNRVESTEQEGIAPERKAEEIRKTTVPTQVPIEGAEAMAGPVTEAIQAKVKELTDAGETDALATINKAVAGTIKETVNTFAKENNMNVNVVDVTEGVGGFTAEGKTQTNPNFILKMEGDPEAIRDVMIETARAMGQRAANSITEVPESEWNTRNDLDDVLVIRISDENFTSLWEDLKSIRDKSDVNIFTGFTKLDDGYNIHGKFYEGDFRQVFEDYYDTLGDLFRKHKTEKAKTKLKLIETYEEGQQETTGIREKKQREVQGVGSISDRRKALNQTLNERYLGAIEGIQAKAKVKPEVKAPEAELPPTQKKPTEPTPEKPGTKKPKVTPEGKPAPPEKIPKGKKIYTPKDIYAYSGDDTKPTVNKFKEGDLYDDSVTNEEDGLIHEMRYLNPSEVDYQEKWEKREDVINKPSTQRYIEWFKQGKEPMPISIHRGILKDGKVISLDRRRVIAAQEAGVDRIPAWVPIGKKSEILGGVEPKQKPKLPVKKPTPPKKPEPIPRTGTFAKNARELYDVNRKIWGLNKVKAFASTVVIDRAIGQMAKRSGITKAEMYNKIEFRKGDRRTEQAIRKGQRANFQGDQGQENYERWVGDNQEVSGADVQEVKNGQPIVAKMYHGTTNEFYEFDASVKGNIDGFLGKVNYFTSDYQDAGSHYLGNGPDLTNRIEHEQETIQGDLEYNFTDGDELMVEDIQESYGLTEDDLEEANFSGDPDNYAEDIENLSQYIADKRLRGDDEKVLEVYVKLNNPAVIGQGQSWIDVIPEESFEGSMEDAAQEIAEEYDVTPEEALEDYAWEVRERAIELEGIENPLVEALQAAIDNNTYAGDVGGKTANEILADFTYDSEVDLNQLEKVLREELAFAENEEGQLSGSQIISDMFEHMGYDGIILNNPSQKFKGMNIGGTTSHIHVFNQYANQIKLADGSNVDFGPSGDIRYQRGKGARGAMMADDGRFIIWALTDPNVSTPLHEIAHVYEQFLTDQEKQDILEWTGQKGWNLTTSEKFARGFERYLADGKAPNSKLQKIFDRFREWLTEIYQDIVKGGINLNLNPKMQDIYTKMLGPEAALKVEAKLPPKEGALKKKRLTKAEKELEAKQQEDYAFNQLIDDIDAYNKLAINRKKSSTKQKLKQKARDMGLIAKSIQSEKLELQRKTKSGKLVKVKKRPIAGATQTSLVSGAKVLTDHDQTTQQEINYILDDALDYLKVGVNALTIPGIGTKVGTLKGTINDIKNNKPTVRANNLLQALIDAKKDGVVNIIEGSGIAVWPKTVPWNEFVATSKANLETPAKPETPKETPLVDLTDDQVDQLIQTHDDTANLINQYIENGIFKADEFLDDITIWSAEFMRLPEGQQKIAEEYGKRQRELQKLQKPAPEGKEEGKGRIEPGKANKEPDRGREEGRRDQVKKKAPTQLEQEIKQSQEDIEHIESEIEANEDEIRIIQPDLKKTKDPDEKQDIRDQIEQYKEDIKALKSDLRKEQKKLAKLQKKQEAANKIEPDTPQGYQPTGDQGQAAVPVMGLPGQQGAADVKSGERISPKGIQQVDNKGRIVKPKTTSQIFQDLEKSLRRFTKVIGSVKYAKRPIPGRANIAGAFSPVYATIAVRAENDLDTLAHELGHGMDQTFGLFSQIPNEIYGEVVQELRPFSIHGSKPPSGHPDPLSYEMQEGIAEWIRAYLVNPDEAIENAPVFHQWYNDALTSEAKQLMDDFGKDLRILAGSTAHDFIMSQVEPSPPTWTENVKKTANELLEAMKPSTRNPNDFKLTIWDKLGQRFTDRLRPWIASVEFAARVGNVDMKKKFGGENPITMARIFSGRNERIDNQLEKGIMEYQDVVRMRDDVTGDFINISWLLQPFNNESAKTIAQEQEEMISYAIAERTIELPLKYVEKQMAEALSQGQIIPNEIINSDERFVRKFKEQNDALREEIYSQNEKYKDNFRDKAIAAKEKIEAEVQEKGKKLEASRDKKLKKVKEKRQELYDQKGEMSEKERQSALHKLRVQTSVINAVFKKDVTRVLKDQRKAEARIDKAVDRKMSEIDRSVKFANIHFPSHAKSFTGIGGRLAGEQALAKKRVSEIEALPEAKKKRIKEALRRYRVFSDRILQLLVKSGRISQESYNAIKATNEQYIALERIMEAAPGEEIEFIARPQGKGLATVKEPLKTIKGSARMIKNPYQSLIEGAYTQMVESDRNEVLRSYVDFMEGVIQSHGPQAKRVSQIISPATRQDKHTIKVFRNGKEHFYKVDKDIFNSLKGITDQTYSLPWLVTALPRLMRSSVTNNPIFAARNLMRDYQTMIVVSDNVKGIGDIIPRGKLKIGEITAEDAYSIFGGGQGGYHLLDSDFYNKALKDNIKKLAQNKGNIMVRGADFAKMAVTSMSKLSEGSEKLTRMQEFKNSFKKHKKMGLSDYHASLQAAYDARSLMDFAISGEFTYVVNQLIPFTNAKIQGFRVALRGVKKNPVLFTAKAAVTIGLPAMLMRLMYDDEEEERYLQLPEYQRNMFWNIPLGEGWITIPKPHEVSIFSTMMDIFYDYAVGNKVSYGAFNEMLVTMMPMSRADFAGPMKTIVEINANKDFFRDKNIVPPYEDGKALKLRNAILASRLSQFISSQIDKSGKLIGAEIEVDPRNVDHFIRGTLTYFGSQAINLSDIGREDKKRPLPTMSGFYKSESPAVYGDVQWLEDASKRYALEQEKYYKLLRVMIHQYYSAETEPQRKKMAQSIRDYSKLVRELWEKNGIKTEAAGEKRMDFRTKVELELSGKNQQQILEPFE